MNPKHVFSRSVSNVKNTGIVQCWVDEFLNLICYNYMLLAQKRNPLLLLVT